MRDYPLLNLFWTMLWFFLWILWIFLLFRIFGDIFRSADLSGWGKAGWTIFVVVLPFLGVFVYLVARGKEMHERDVARAQAQAAAVREYLMDAAADSHGRSATSADELTKLAALRDQGILTDQEFSAQKAKLLV